MSTLFVLLAPFAIAMAAYFGHVVVRGTKVSEFRQKWVDDQRADLAIIVSRSYVLLQLEKMGAELDPTRASVWGELEEAALRIKLRENPLQPEWPDVIQRIDHLRASLRREVASLDDVSSLSCGIIALARLRMKREWNLVRDGETSYRRTAHIYWVAIIALLCMGLSFVAFNLLVPSGPDKPIDVILHRAQ
jgi:hypothetical protein